MFPLSAFFRCLIRIAPSVLAGWSGAQAAPPSFALSGFASIAAYGDATTSGGGNARITVVHTAQEFQAAAERLDIKDKSARETAPRVIQLAGDIDLGELANQPPGDELKAVGVVRIRSHTTIVSEGAGATIRRGTLDIHGAHNVIIRNLKFRDLWENDPTGAYDKMGWDYIRVTSGSNQTKSHHVWIDHCDFERVYDGMIDVVHGSDLVTISWCRFAGTPEWPHKKCILIGHSASATAAAMDRGKLNVTLHGNWFENIEDRAPRTRFGNIHCLNNYVHGAVNGVISVMNAATLVENCVFWDVRIATTYSHAKDTAESDKGGRLSIVGSQNLEPRALLPPRDKFEAFEHEHNFLPTSDAAEFQFNPPEGFAWPDLQKLPYGYLAAPAEQVPALVEQYAGTGRLTEADLPADGRAKER